MSNILQQIQSQLKVPKNQYNSFGKYHYRSLEDILDAVKPLLEATGLSLVMRDEPREVQDAVYIIATAELYDENKNVIASAQATARHAETKKGMDDSQITGSTSSYARKYCLNGLFAIDDTKDADAVNTHDKQQSATNTPKNQCMTAEEGQRIKRARESCNCSQEAVLEIMRESPMSCQNPPHDLLSKHVGKVVERIYEEAEKQKEN